MKHRFLFAALAAAFGAARLPAASTLVSTEWLAGHLDDSSIVVLHVGAQADYDAGHIPGARLLTLASISVNGEDDLRVELPPVEQLRLAFAGAGVTDQSRIVLCAGTDSVPAATRVFFTLDYAGLGDRTALLDGGLPLWRSEGRPLSTETPAVKPGALTLRPRPELAVYAGWLRGRLGDGGTVILDTRAPEYYTGASAGMMPRAGHIPGARNIPFTATFDEQRRFHSLDELRRLLAVAGAQEGKTLVSYCHIGMQATVVYFAARLLGRDVRLYDGSFQDWSRRAELPVETSAVPAN
ncbi:MAG: sulfurtransferase [Bryobacteraceae bacterium]|nr:sulfurtransferase [Bryobacteraceae bacterium]